MNIFLHIYWKFFYLILLVFILFIIIFNMSRGRLIFCVKSCWIRNRLRFSRKWFPKVHKLTVLLFNQLILFFYVYFFNYNFIIFLFLCYLSVIIYNFFHLLKARNWIYNFHIFQYNLLLFYFLVLFIYFLSNYILFYFIYISVFIIYRTIIWWLSSEIY